MKFGIGFLVGSFFGGFIATIIFACISVAAQADRLSGTNDENRF